MSRRIAFTMMWLLSDAVVFAGAYALAYFARVGWIFSTDLSFRTYMMAVVLTVPGWLVVMVTMRNFALSRDQSSLKTGAYIAYAAIIGMAGFALVFYFQEQTLFSRRLLLLAGVLSMALVWAWHGIVDVLQRRWLRAGRPAYPLLVIGVNREAQRVVERLQRTRSPLTPVAILSGKSGAPKDVGGVPVCGKLDALEAIIAQKGITHVLQCDHLEQSINLASACRAHRITYLLLPFVLGVVEHDVPTESLEGHTVIAVHPRNRWWEWAFR
jgi:FlaA1/EpsC-like NDP-sugar epimerase